MGRLVGRLSSNQDDKKIVVGSRKPSFTARGIISVNKPGYHADPENKGLYQVRPMHLCHASHRDVTLLAY